METGVDPEDGGGGGGGGDAGGVGGEVIPDPEAGRAVSGPPPPPHDANRVRALLNAIMPVMRFMFGVPKHTCCLGVGAPR